MYRVSLALFQAKIMEAQSVITAIQDTMDEFETYPANADLISTVKCLVRMPDQISLVINALGWVKTNGKLYVPKVGKNNYTSEQQFIPQSEQVTYDNLRRVVESLANADTPAKYRESFYRCNPIPGCKWVGAPENPILLNADDIIPVDYNIQNLHTDVSEIMEKLNFIDLKAPEYYFKTIYFETEGDSSMLVCNGQENLRVVDRRAGEELEEYLKTLRLEGNIRNYYNLQELTSTEQKEGCLCLLGEHPTIADLVYPVYVTRDKRNCTEIYSLTYKDRRIM
ncbi:hypothetical protein JTB14_007422 [Gonioctena quinquepunctata]|nr:hypothetical protein JTB14_007422 [Gonioctena quinquepunctata]